MGTGHWREGGRGEERTPHSCVALLLLTGRCAVSDIQGEILGGGLHSVKDRSTLVLEIHQALLDILLQSDWHAAV